MEDLDQIHAVSRVKKKGKKIERKKRYKPGFHKRK